MQVLELDPDKVQEMIGYRPFTTFFSDFSIAEVFGKDAIEDTYHRIFESWKDNYKYLTELVLILNWKLWHFYDKNETFAELYEKLFYKAQDYCYENLTGEELTYFYRVIN